MVVRMGEVVVLAKVAMVVLVEMVVLVAMVVLVDMVAMMWYIITSQVGLAIFQQLPEPDLQQYEVRGSPPRLSRPMPASPCTTGTST